MKNLFVRCGIFFALAFCVSCYDFQDPYYNQVLAADVQDLENSTQFEDDDNGEQLHSRKRRAVTVLTTTVKPPLPECKPISYFPCCDLNLPKPTPIEEEYRRTCYKEIFLQKDNSKSNTTSTYDPFNCEKIIKMRNNILCLTQCYAKKLKLADANGNPLPEAISNYISKKHKETWIASSAKDISMKCVKQVKDITMSFLRNKTQTTCNPALQELSFCVFKEMQLNCPKEQISNPKRCEMFKMYAKNSPNA